MLEQINADKNVKAPSEDEIIGMEKIADSDLSMKINYLIHRIAVKCLGTAFGIKYAMR
jgi:hypothetical protein